MKKIDSCELCGHRFVFASVYSDGAPNDYRGMNLCVCLCKWWLRAIKLFEVVYCIFLWLLLLPVLVKWGFAIWEQEKYSFAVRTRG